MPVPVPRYSKPAAHPVFKTVNRVLGQTQRTTAHLPVRASALPPTFGSREDSLSAGRRVQQRSSWDQASAQQQDFYQGLIAAGNAPVIKGAHAEACIPPMYNLPQPEVAGNIYALEHPSMQGDAARRARDEAQFHSKMLWDAAYGGIDMNGQQRLSPSDDAACNYHLSGFVEDHSPGSASGPDSGSSPMEPVTPFANFVDQAVATAQHYEDYGLTAEHFQEAYQADLVYPSIAEAPKEQEPITETSTAPSATVSYKRLSGPLAEWVANYVWKICTTGFSLPSAYAQPCVNAGPYTVAPPAYLAPSIHTLLLSTLLQPSAVFLAVWYMIRLPVYFGASPLAAEFAKERAFRAAFLGDAPSGFEREASENSAPFRLVVLGCMLANKWLDDHTFSNKTWHSISNIPVQTLNTLESLALDIYTYDLSVSSKQWSQWLGHVLSYHLSLAPPGRPQPISRPSSNPHSIVRRSIEEILLAPTASKAAGGIPQPVFLGLEDRLREKLEKEAAMAIDVLEIDLDEDGPLREEYLPKRRNAQPRESSAEKWHTVESAPVLAKVLPPPAKWSPAGDEPILRDRNRSSGQYVAVQAPVATMQYASNCHPQDFAFNQNWNHPAAYMPIKSHVYEMPYLLRLDQPAYNPFGHIAPVPLPHSRSQSLSYDQESLSRNHMRSYSQARFDYTRNDLRMSVGEQRVPIPEMESRWMDGSQYPYSGPAFAIPAVGLQPNW